MKNEKLLILFASLVTIVLGPGAGHLVIKEWKKAIFFITLALALFFVLCITFVSEVGTETLNAVLDYTSISDLEKFKDIYYKFQDNNPKTMLFFDIFFSGLWAYSIVDIFMIGKQKEFFTKKNNNEKD